MDFAEQSKVPTIQLTTFKSIPGYGLEGSAQIDGRELSAYIGRPEYIAERLSPQSAQRLIKTVEEIRASGELIAILALDQALFFFKFRDTLRPRIPETIEALKKQNRWHLLMLTGDHEASAKRISAETGIEEYYANLTPADKLEYVSRLSHDKGLIMVGDGINDAPAMARATVGICMGQVGSSTAIEAADVILLQDNLERLDWLMKKAAQTQAIVKQNLFIATAAICIAAFPALGGFVPLWLAVIMHEGGTVIVGLNALRLLKK